MKTIIESVIKRSLYKILGVSRLKAIIKTMARIAGVDLLSLAHESIGILKYWNEEVSGEAFVINSFLKERFQNKNNLVLFDVGANIGQYALMLHNAFPESSIYAFEPNLHTFKILCQNLNGLNAKAFALGLGSRKYKQKIYTYSNNLVSSHASIYKNVLTDLHRINDVVEIDFEAITVDEFCSTNNIDFIDFIKIDTEGNELEVLVGANYMLSNNKINIIQFEFNEMNVISRVFLKDFYAILTNYNIYRLDSSRLIPLFEYESRNEIFQFQNILAVLK